jgi:isopenicillin N synthase-like dioxygenase
MFEFGIRIIMPMAEFDRNFFEIDLGNSCCNNDRNLIAEALLLRGWTVIRFKHDEETFSSLKQWHSTFESVFSLNNNEKVSGGVYRNAFHVSVGYKIDEQREFIESHRLSTCTVSPNYEKFVPLYQQVTQEIYDSISSVAEFVLNGISEKLELDQQLFVDLTDVADRGILNPITLPPHKVGDTEFYIADSSYSALSSSVLRICNYNAVNDTIFPKVVFGSHTDTSFLTISFLSKTPGLEILDQLTDEWVCPELLFPVENSLIVFTGEFLQVLTKHLYKAAVHRVVAYSPSTRISCPMIIRGNDSKIIDFHDTKYNHPGGEVVLSRSYIPDLDGSNVGTVHKILDLKRAKRWRKFVDENNVESEWVLSSYPIQSKYFALEEK